MNLLKTNLSLFAYDPEKDKNTNYAAQMQAILDKGEANLTAADYQNLANLEKAANEKVNYLNQTGTNQWGAQTSSKYQDMYASMSGGKGSDTHYTPPSNYQPLGGGTDWDDKYMNETDYQLVKSYGDAWTSAMAAGNTELANHYHDLAEQLRAKYSYKGGSDGSQYIPTELPSAQQMTEDDIIAKLNRMVGPSPDWNSRWDETKNLLANAYLNMNYDDFLDSEQYRALASRYGLNGKNAMQNVLGQVASRTGGLASSYSTSVASQAYNDYMAQLEAAAYDMYGGELDSAYKKAMAAYGYDDADYEMYLNDLAQWNKEYGYAQDALAQALGQSNYNQEWDYKVSQAEKNDAMDRIDAFLSMGGMVSDLDPSLISASGYTQNELNQLQNYYQKKLNPVAGGSSNRNPSPAGDENPAPEKDRPTLSELSKQDWKDNNEFIDAALAEGYTIEDIEHWARYNTRDVINGRVPGRYTE